MSRGAELRHVLASGQGTGERDSPKPMLLSYVEQYVYATSRTIARTRQRSQNEMFGDSVTRERVAGLG